MLIKYVQLFNRRYGFLGHLWQGRFKSPAIQCEGYLLSCGRYIERNPLEAGIVIEPWQYAWSSCRAYACGTADSLLAENRLIFRHNAIPRNDFCTVSPFAVSPFAPCRVVGM